MTAFAGMTCLLFESGRTRHEDGGRMNCGSRTTSLRASVDPGCGSKTELRGCLARPASPGTGLRGEGRTARKGTQFRLSRLWRAPLFRYSIIHHHPAAYVIASMLLLRATKHKTWQVVSGGQDGGDERRASRQKATQFLPRQGEGQVVCGKELRRIGPAKNTGKQSQLGEVSSLKAVGGRSCSAHSKGGHGAAHTLQTRPKAGLCETNPNWRAWVSGT